MKSSRKSCIGTCWWRCAKGCREAWQRPTVLGCLLAAVVSVADGHAALAAPHAANKSIFPLQLRRSPRAVSARAGETANVKVQDRRGPTSE
jgi:hypothetical protein